MPKPTSDNYVTTSGAARRLNKSEGTIRLWERSGRLTAIRTENGIRLFRLADILAERQREEQRRAG